MAAASCHTLVSFFTVGNTASDKSDPAGRLTAGSLLKAEGEVPAFLLIPGLSELPEAVGKPGSDLMGPFTGQEVK